VQIRDSDEVVGSFITVTADLALEQVSKLSGWKKSVSETTQMFCFRQKLWMTRLQPG
jgi:hypothetical protein